VRRLAEAIGAYAGLDPPPWLLEARVRERADELGLEEEAYLERVHRDTGERARLLERLRVGETRFFRHRAQIDALRAHILPRLFARGEPVRCWSAGCATGEEAFTLAALCDEVGSAWEVVGTDLSNAAIASAESGRFPARRLEEIPERYRHHFTFEGDHLRVRDLLRARVRFQCQNLVEAPHPRAVDLVVCRNVLIYFDAERRAQVVLRLGAALRTGGWLCLGYSEALRGGEEARLEPVRLGETVLYRRREITARVELHRDEEAEIEVPLPAPAPAEPEPPLLRLRGEYHDGARLAAELRPFIYSGGALVDLDGAHFLGDEAARVLQRARQAAPGLLLKATRPAILRWMGKHGIR
jgi:chemotaxis methyl-accepting protein methylase